MSKRFFIVLIIAAAAVAAGACSFSTANISGITVSKDKDGKQSAAAFKAGETIYAEAVVANAPGKVTVKMYLAADDAAGLKKDETLPGSEVKVDLASSGTAKYSLPIPSDAKSGRFIVFADLLDEKGEKKDTKSVAISIEALPATIPAAARTTEKDVPRDDEDTPEPGDRK